MDAVRSNNKNVPQDSLILCIIGSIGFAYDGTTLYVRLLTPGRKTLKQKRSHVLCSDSPSINPR